MTKAGLEFVAGQTKTETHEWEVRGRVQNG